MKLFAKLAFFAFFAATCSVVAFAQVVTVVPAKAQAGQTITVTYNPLASGAVLAATEDVCVTIRTGFPAEEEKLFKLNKEGAVFKREIALNPEWPSLDIQFKSAQKRDEPNK